MLQCTVRLAPAVGVGVSGSHVIASQGVLNILCKAVLCLHGALHVTADSSSVWKALKWWVGSHSIQQLHLHHQGRHISLHSHYSLSVTEKHNAGMCHSGTSNKCACYWLLLCHMRCCYCLYNLLHAKTENQILPTLHHPAEPWNAVVRQLSLSEPLSLFGHTSGEGILRPSL